VGKREREWGAEKLLRREVCLNGDGDDVVCWFTSLKTQDGTIQMHQEYNTRASS